ncbi:zinc ribbon domain-containing protein [Ruminococcus sp.]|uniref:zinc ribbon domain-containing protein n=1 Tax=Ruminococcus sp. TaxID=41978 RepID=UPI0025D05596|nr:zinc ribbon domain-containing protein [Ruminococcus sp.]MBQ8967913.1 zinc ribbon domain-containing protein [Ruminococcus sp.]
MKCPKCGKAVGDHDAICPSCGAEMFIDTKLAEKLFKKNEEPVPDDEKPRKKFRLGGRFKFDLHNIKLIAIAVLSVLIIVLIVILVIQSISAKGEKYAKKASDFIGADFEIASKKMDFKIKQESGYKGLTAVVDYNYVAESDDDVRIDGVNYPEWAVVFKTDDADRITEVRYCDFKGIKSDIKGVKKEHMVNLDKFNAGTDKATVDKELDMDFYSVSYTKDGEAYIYRYWYENDSGDEQAVVLTVFYDSDGGFKSYTAQPIYHQYM